MKFFLYILEAALIAMAIAALVAVKREEARAAAELESARAARVEMMGGAL